MSKSTNYVYTMSELGGVGAWSIYEFPWVIDSTAMLGDTLYLRSGDAVYAVSPSVLDDEIINGAGDGFDSSEVIAEMQSHYLDFGSGGVTKQMIGFDLVGSGTALASIGFDQTDLTKFTPDFSIPGDTSVGFIIPMPVTSVSFSLRLLFSSDDGPWEWLASNFYITDFRTTS